MSERGPGVVGEVERDERIFCAAEIREGVVNGLGPTAVAVVNLLFSDCIYVLGTGAREVIALWNSVVHLCSKVVMADVIQGLTITMS